MFPSKEYPFQYTILLNTSSKSGSRTILIYNVISYIFRLLPIYVVVSLSLVISHAKAIEHPRLRSTRSKDNHRPHIHVSVRPKEIDLYPGEVITIACRAKGGTKMEEVPFISFYVSLFFLFSIPIYK